MDNLPRIVFRIYTQAQIQESHLQISGHYISRGCQHAVDELLEA
jgi:hypothetical protein